MAKKYEDVSTTPDDVSVLSGTAITVSDAGRPVWIRREAIDAFYGLGQPVTAWRIVLRSGQALIVDGTDAAKADLLDALG